MKLFSSVSDVQVVVVKAPPAAVEVACGGAPMVDAEPAGPAAADDVGEGPLLGKRYADAQVGIELLCTKAGTGALTVDGRPLGIKTAKPLPSSD